MKPNIKLAEAKTPDGKDLALYEHDGSYCIRMNNREIMHSLSNASEYMLGKVGANSTSHLTDPLIFIGGLGLGFTLKSVLESSAKKARIQVAEIIPEVISWNREFLLGLNGNLLNDPRVELLKCDAFSLIKNSKNGNFDSIILDTDNGPTALVQKENSRLYSRNGLQVMYNKLKPYGKLAIWSATEDPEFVSKLNKAKFRVEPIPAKSHEGAKRFNHMIYLAHKK